MAKVVFLNGGFISFKKVKLFLLNPGFLYGWSVFETMRAYKNKIIYLEKHLARLKQSAGYLDLALPYSLDKIKKIIFKTLELNQIKDAYVRLTLFKNIKRKNAFFVYVKKYRAYPQIKYQQGFKVGLAQLRINTDYFFTGLKTGNYLLYEFAYQQARKKGYEEAVLLNNQGYVVEGVHSNIFWVKERKLFTPALKCGCLAGITRQWVLDFAKENGIKTIQGFFTLKDAKNAEEIFITNSLIGIMPVGWFINRKLKRDKFKTTDFLRQNYNYFLKHGT